MKRAFYVVAIALALSGAAAGPALTAPVAAPVRTAPATVAPATTAPPAPTARVPFGCDARAPNVCHFRIFFEREDRIVILPAGMKENRVPAIVGGGYCMTLGKAPVYKCARKVINNKYNS